MNKGIRIMFHGIKAPDLATHHEEHNSSYSPNSTNQATQGAHTIMSKRSKSYKTV